VPIKIILNLFLRYLIKNTQYLVNFRFHILCPTSSFPGLKSRGLPHSNHYTGYKEKNVLMILELKIKINNTVLYEKK
jgi:hypothetical protein